MNWDLEYDEPSWWQTAVVYQIYPRSFADSDGDGIGDLAGIQSRLDYLAELGVDAVWLTPFYPSPLVDGGYDITDHRDVDPRLGSMDDFDDLVIAAHAHDIKIIIDIVPNHTSDQHPWFLEAAASPPGSPARNRYVFRPGDATHPPSDWRSHFGGSAWEPIGDGESYLHLFASQQPDLNWDNPEIREYFLDTLRFWADRGVDGFRVDVAHALAKDLSEPLRSQPLLDSNLPLDGTDPLYDRDELHDIYQTWRKVFDEYDPPRMAVAETWTPTNGRTYLYARPNELGQVFDFTLLKATWDRDEYLTVIRRSLADHQAHAELDGGLTWVLSSHDVPRHASRLALPKDIHPDVWLVSGNTAPTVDPALGLRRARAATLMMLALPGSAYLYQGEELGLPEVANLPAEALQDPIRHRTNNTVKGRDGCRIPLPWTISGTSHGFGSNGTWLPQPSWFGEYSVESQQTQPDSTLRLYRNALRQRKAMQTADSTVTWHNLDDRNLLHFRRANGWECVVNFSGLPQPLPPGEAIISSQPVTNRTLPPNAAVWLQTHERSRNDTPRSRAHECD